MLDQIKLKTGKLVQEFQDDLGADFTEKNLAPETTKTFTTEANTEE